MTNAINQFDRGKPFYPAIFHYACHFLGFHEVLRSGFTIAIDGLRKKRAAAGLEETSEVMAGIETDIARLGRLQLRCGVDGTKIPLSLDQFAKDVVAHSQYLAKHTMYAAGVVLVMAYEMNADKPWNDRGPLWEFLRHCRNGVAHGGNFNLASGQPKRPASWGPFNITRALNGTPVFRNETSAGLLFPGDPIKLLWDIEQAYPQMAV